MRTFCKLLFMAFFVALPVSPFAQAQTQPTDPLTLLKQQEQQHAANATQAAETAVELQREQLREKHGSNGVGANAAEAPKLAETLTDAQVRAAMTGGADYLLRRLSTYIAKDSFFTGIPAREQRPWVGFAGDQGVGVVALDIYALLETGRATGDARLRPFSAEMKPLVDWLIRARSRQTYSAALQESALSVLPQRHDIHVIMQGIRDDLVKGMHANGGYSYSLNPQSDFWDNSNTQYALLGMWAASEAGVEVPVRFWQAADAHWRTTQASSGGWSYVQPVEGFTVDDPNSGTSPTPALTAAGVASLYVTLDHRNGGKDPPGGDEAINRGLAAVSSDFRNNLGMLGDDLYYTYAVQRVGVASGLKYIGDVNWYRRAAAAIVLSQRANGSWSYAYSELTGTAYALLVLAHRGAPVAFNKLQYGSPVVFNKLQYEGQWDAYPRDDANLTRRLAKEMEQPLNWQIVEMRNDASDWLDAPVLLVTGKGDPGFRAVELAKLRAFVNAGGIIFSVAEDNDPAFTEAVKRYASELVEGRYGMRRLPADHPLFTLQEKVTDVPEMWGMSNGVRELWVHSSQDFANSWQHFAYSMKNDWAIPVNLYVYSTGKNPPHNRLSTLALPWSAPSAANASTLPAGESNQMTIACLVYPGNCDPEPGAWPRFARAISTETKLAVEVQATEISGLDVRKFPIAHMTGTDHFALNDASRKQLADYLASGGVLFADAAGGSEEFAESFLELAKSVAPGSQIDILPADHLMLNGLMAGSVRLDGDHTGFRKSTPLGKRASGRPEIWVWKVGGRNAIFFSPLDVTSGLLGSETWGIVGYSPETSEGLARDFLLYEATAATTTETRSHEDTKDHEDGK